MLDIHVRQYDDIKKIMPHLKFRQLFSETIATSEELKMNFLLFLSSEFRCPGIHSELLSHPT
jgi:hypothetical protein